MKYIFLVTVVFIGLSSCNGSHFRKKVAIQNNTLTLTVDVKNDKQVVDYQHSFDITGLNKQQQDALVQNICDSLGVE